MVIHLFTMLHTMGNSDVVSMLLSAGAEKDATNSVSLILMSH